MQLALFSHYTAPARVLVAIAVSAVHAGVIPIQNGARSEWDAVPRTRGGDPLRVEVLRCQVVALYVERRSEGSGSVVVLVGYQSFGRFRGSWSGVRVSAGSGVLG